MFFIIQQETIGRDPVQNAIIMDEKSKKRIDVYIPETHVVIEQKSIGIPLDNLSKDTMEKQHTNRQKNMIIYSAKALNREKRPSVLKQLRTIAAKIAELPGKVVNRDKKRELDR